MCSRGAYGLRPLLAPDAIELCRAFPALRVVGLEPAPARWPRRAATWPPPTWATASSFTEVQVSPSLIGAFRAILARRPAWAVVHDAGAITPQRGA